MSASYPNLFHPTHHEMEQLSSPRKRKVEVKEEGKDELSEEKEKNISNSSWNKAFKTVSLKYQQEYASKINDVRLRVKTVAILQIIYSSVCLALLTASLFVGTFFSIVVVENPVPISAKPESPTAIVIRFLWFSVPAFFAETCLVLWASIRLLRATEKNVTIIHALEGIRFWQKVNSMLITLGGLAIIFVLPVEQVLYIVSYCFVMGRLYFLVEVIPLKEYFEVFLAMNTPTDDKCNGATKVADTKIMYTKLSSKNKYN